MVFEAYIKGLSIYNVFLSIDLILVPICHVIIVAFNMLHIHMNSILVGMCCKLDICWSEN